MPLNCELVPRSDARADDLKRLGAALRMWFDTFVLADPEADGWLDQTAVDDLLAGELPKPFVLRCLSDMFGMTSRELIDAIEQARSEHPLLDRILPVAHARSVPFGFSLDAEDYDNVLESLRSAIPMDVVAGVRINGLPAWRSNDDREV